MQEMKKVEELLSIIKQKYLIDFTVSEEEAELLSLYSALEKKNERLKCCGNCILDHDCPKPITLKNHERYSGYCSLYQPDKEEVRK